MIWHGETMVQVREEAGKGGSGNDRQVDRQQSLEQIENGRQKKYNMGAEQTAAQVEHFTLAGERRENQQQQ